MTWNFLSFGWDTEDARPEVIVQPLAEPEDIEVEFDAIGADDEMADVMFALRDGDGTIKETWRPEPMQLVVIETMRDARAYTLVTVDNHGETRHTRDLTPDTFDRLLEVKLALKDAETGYITDAASGSA